MVRKGRNKHLVSLRDEKLIKRYYFWTEVRRLRFDDALKILSENEFFISEERIMTIIRDNFDKLDEIASMPKQKKTRATHDPLAIFPGE